MDLTETGWEGVEWFHPALVRQILVNTVMNLQILVPQSLLIN
jgi:hypothetical protein